MITIRNSAVCDADRDGVFVGRLGIIACYIEVYRSCILQNRPLVVYQFQGNGSGLVFRGQRVFRYNVFAVLFHILSGINVSNFHIVSAISLFAVGPVHVLVLRHGIGSRQKAVSLLILVGGSFIGTGYLDGVGAKKAGVIRNTRINRQIIVGRCARRRVNREIPIHIIFVDYCTEIATFVPFVDCKALRIGTSVERRRNFNGLDLSEGNMCIMKRAIRVKRICIAIEDQIVPIFPAIMNY